MADLSTLDKAARSAQQQRRLPSESFGFGTGELSVNESYPNTFDYDVERPLAEQCAEQAQKGGDVENEQSPVPGLLTDERIHDEIAAFIASLQEPKYESKPSGAEISGLFQSFYDNFATLSQKLIIGDSNSIELATKDELDVRKKRAKANSRLSLELAQEKVESIVTAQLYTKLYDTLLDPEQQRLVDYLGRKCSCLAAHEELLDLLNLNVSDELKSNLSPVISALAKLDNVYEPKKKIDLFVEAHQRLVSVLEPSLSPAVEAETENAKPTSKHFSRVSLDLLLPVLTFAIVNSSIESLYQHILYVRRFRRTNSISGFENYCITNFEAAFHILETASLLNVDGLPDGVDLALFSAEQSDTNLLEPAKGSSTASPVLPTSKAPSRSTSQTSISSSKLSIRSRFKNLGTSFSSDYRNLITTLNREAGSRPESETTATIEMEQPAKLGEQTAQHRTIDVSSPEPRSMPLLYVEQRFLKADADTLTLGDVRELLKQYQYLGNELLKRQ